MKTNITRRNFVKASALATGTLVSGPAIIACSEGNTGVNSASETFPAYRGENYNPADGVSGLLFSQIGYEPGYPVRIVIRLPKKELLHDAVCKLVPVSNGSAHHSACIYWGECWRSHWWIAEFSGVAEEGEWNVEVHSKGDCVFKDNGLKVAHNLLWDKTIELGSADMLERRVHFTKVGAGWHFDEGTGTTATAYSMVQHVATFTAGNASIFGAEAMSPSWVTGVNGGHAISLDKGAHLEVPYTTSFLPANLSISVWVKPSELYENNYILSQNFWNGYKLQTQGGGKPFFTYKKVDGGIIDANNEMDNSITAGEWNHIIITLDGTSKELKFYINGTLTKTWTESTKSIGPLIQTLTSPDPQPFVIGCVATDAQIATWEWTETPTSLGYFKGAIDELKIYNIALSAGQIIKLHNHEKP